MTATLFSLLPMIIGSAVVPVQIIFVLLLLTGESKGLAKAAAFVLGMTLARLAQGVLFRLVLAGGNAGTEGESDSLDWIVATLLTVLGILLLISFYRAFTGEEDPDAPPPKWMTMLETMTPLLALGAGVGMILISAKLWVFTLSALGAIGDARLGQPASSITFILFILLAQSLLILPILARLLFPQTSADWLRAMADWLEAHNRQIVMVISLIFGLLFLYKGISGFF